MRYQIEVLGIFKTTELDFAEAISACYEIIKNFKHERYDIQVHLGDNSVDITTSSLLTITQLIETL